MASAPRPELSRPLQLEDLPHGGVTRIVEPDAAERGAVARRLDLVDLATFRAELTVTPRGRGKNLRIAVKGKLHAEVTQSCVATFEPVQAVVEATIDRLFAEGAPPSPEAETDLDQPDLEPLPETFLDLGEIAVEELSLALDPYPRAPDAEARLAATLAAKGIGFGEEQPEEPRPS